MTNDNMVWVTIEYHCEECGVYEVIKSKSTLVQYCGCGKLSRPVSIVNAAIKMDDKWIVRKLQNDNSKTTN